ncbi:MAG: beta-hexosaminidase [Oscillospiraceae bacterium]|nr:beta-hexosaminidase [Oscillospiraceae bacterium]
MKRVMKRTAAVTALTLCAVMLSGCSAVSEFIENDSNIGKNKPALGTVDQSVTTVVIAETEETVQTEAEKVDRTAEKAAKILSEMTVEEKLAQLILARYPDNAAEVMSEYQLGGYTMYAEDFQYGTAESVKAETDEVKSAAKVTPFIAVDEEGGSVVRISCWEQYCSEPFSSPQVLYQRGGSELLAVDSEEKSELLKSLGINLNLAPVCDITDDTSAYIYDRTVGQDAETTAAAITSIVEAANSVGVASCLKHFPGYGSSTDTHTGYAQDDRLLSEILSSDVVPFSAGIAVSENMQPAVMVSHNVYSQINAELPASLAPEIYSLLRNQVGFNGVAITDDLSMEAAANYGGEAPASVAAVTAGADMICVSDYKSAYSELSAAYDDGTITDEMLDEHVTRILVMKIQYKICT